MCFKIEMKSLHHSLLFLIVLLSSTLNAQNIEINFSGIRSSKGQIIVRVYKDSKSFENDEPYKIHYFKKSTVSKGTMTASLKLDPGTYGLALADDENNSYGMNYGLLGIPSEGFGFSNYYHTGMSYPKFESFKFTVTKDEKKKVTMKIRYM
jgi:uncharacterized protein (DUF2141 family)